MNKQNVGARLTNVENGVDDGDVMTVGQKKTFVNGVNKVTTKEYTGSATISNGSCIFYLTDDGTIDGNPIFSNVYLESCHLHTNDSNAAYVYGNIVISEDKKSLTVDVNKLGSVVLGIIQFVSGSNGTTVYLSVKGD